MPNAAPPSPFDSPRPPAAGDYLLEQCRAVVAELAPEAPLDRVVVDRSKPDRGSDFQSAAAMQLTKLLRKPPRAIAEQLVAALEPRLAGFATLDISGPGFLGFTLTEDALGRYLAATLADDRLGTPQIEDETVVIDFSSPNVAKRMHVGHIRSTVIGDAMRRMGLFLGYRVIGDNHIGDWGTQFGQLIYAWDRWLDKDAFEDDAIAELERLYVDFNKRAETEPELKDAARAELAKLQAGDERNLELWQMFREKSQVAFDRIYSRLDVHFDVTYGESHYNEALQPLVERLLEEGVAEPSEGAVCVFFRDEDGEDTMTPFLIRKKDGAALYSTTDLATVELRLATWSPSRIIYITDFRQKLHFDQLFATARRMGVPDDVDFVHIGFGVMKLPTGAIKTRHGNTIRLDELLDEAERRARAVQAERATTTGEQWTEAELDQLAAAIGIGAVKYADLSNNPQSDIMFSFDRMLSFEGNTAPYLQYTSARTHSLEQRAADRGLAPADGATFVLSDPLERALLLHLLSLGAATRRGFDEGKPSALATWLHEAATHYHRWYQACSVLGADDPKVAASRMNLNRLAQSCLSAGLGMLGIVAPERM